MVVDHAVAILDAKFDHSRTSHEQRVASALRQRRQRLQQRKRYMDDDEEEEELDTLQPLKPPRKKPCASGAAAAVTGAASSAAIGVSVAGAAAPTTSRPSFDGSSPAHLRDRNNYSYCRADDVCDTASCRVASGETNLGSKFRCSMCNKMFHKACVRA